jgi:hypothetical protein
MNVKILLVIIALAIVGTISYFFGVKSLGQSVTIPTAIPSTESPQETPTAVPSSGKESKGTVAGKLCFPSEGIPPGTIVAKDIGTKQTFSQNYAGTEAGAGNTYKFELPVGTYHIKFQLAGSAGYYNECAKNPTFDVCSSDASHDHIELELSENITLKNVDLCDFYATEAQKQNLESTF